MIGDIILDERMGPLDIASPSSASDSGQKELLVVRRNFCHLLLLTQPLGQAALLSLLNDHLTPPQALALCQTCRHLLSFRGAVTVAEVQGRRRFNKLLGLLNRGAFPRLLSLTCLPLSIPGQQQPQSLGPLEARSLASQLLTEASDVVPRALLRPTLPHLCHLNLCRQELGDGATVLFDALRVCHPWLLSLRLDGTALGPSSCASLAHCLSALYTLTCLSLRGCGITHQDMATLAPSLPPHSLKELHLSNNPFLADVRGLHALVGGGGFEPSGAVRGLHTLSLGGTLLQPLPSSRCLKLLGTALEHHQAPQALTQGLLPPTKTGQSRRRFHSGQYTTPRSQRLQQGISPGPSTSPLLPCLVTLDLWHAEVDDEGAGYVAQGLHAGLLLGSLTSLALDSHPTQGTEAWVLLAHAVQAYTSGTGPSGPPLQRLRLGHDNPSAKGCKALGTMLHDSLPNLHTLDLSGCELGDAKMEVILRGGALCTHPCLSTLRLSGVGMGQQALHALLPTPTHKNNSSAQPPSRPAAAAVPPQHPAAGLLALAAGRPTPTPSRLPLPTPAAASSPAAASPLPPLWPSLTHLDLSDNHLQTSAAPTFAMALKQGGLPLLRLWDVSLNNLGRRGVQILIQSVRGPPPLPHLSRLSLYVNGLGHSDLEEVGVEARAAGAPERIRKAFKL